MKTVQAHEGLIFIITEGGWRVLRSHQLLRLWAIGLPATISSAMHAPLALWQHSVCNGDGGGCSLLSNS